MSEETESSKDEIARRAKVDEQMDLALGDDRLIIDYSEPPRHYTAMRFKEKDENRYKAAVKFLALGFSIDDVARRVRATHHTISAVKLNCIEDIKEQERELHKVTFAGAAILFDKAIELAPDLKDSQKAAIAGGILFDKWAQLSGKPTVKIEISGHVDLHTQFSNLLKEAEEKMKLVKGTVVEAPMLENGEEPE